MTCCLMTPSHYLNQCWLFFTEGLWQSSQNNFTATAEADIPYDELENLLLKSMAHLPGADIFTDDLAIEEAKASANMVLI